MLATDGKISFAMSIYDRIEVRDINEIPFSIGIDAGEGMLVSSINEDSQFSSSFLGYRIDGWFML